jgi:hypothetical protein
MDIRTNRCRDVQWLLEEPRDFEFTLKSVKTGKYLGLPHDGHDGTPVCAVDHPYKWSVIPDEKDKWTQR